MDLIPLIFSFLIIIPSAILHEYMHGWTANQLGDPTAKYAGRLTLDPRVHVDTFGSLILPLILFLGSGGRFLFAYAKPVPYNPYNLRNQKWGPALVAIAGPLANIALALAFGLLIQLGLFPTLIPFFAIIVQMNIVLAVFNLVPIPPLDGSKILFAVMPDSLVNLRVTLERYGFILLLVFIFFFFRLLEPVIDWLFRLFVGAW